MQAACNLAVLKEKVKTATQKLRSFYLRGQEVRTDQEVRTRLSHLGNLAATGATESLTVRHEKNVVKALRKPRNQVVQDWFMALPDELFEDPSDDEESDMDMQQPQAPAQQQNAPLALTLRTGDTSKHDGAGWSEGNKCLRMDPRFKPLGPVLLPDEPADPGRPKVGSRRIDPTFSGLYDPKFARVVQELGKILFAGAKQPGVIPANMDGSHVKLVYKDLDITHSSNPNMMTLLIIHMMAQSGKAAETRYALWGFAFCLGVMPYLQLRNAGGIGDAQVVQDDIEEMNKEIKGLVERLRFNKDEDGKDGQGPWGTEFAWLTAPDYDRFTLTPRIATKDKLTVSVQPAPWVASSESNEFVVRLDRPQCMICLLTPGSMNAMHVCALVLNP